MQFLFSIHIIICHIFHNKYNHYFQFFIILFSLVLKKDITPIKSNTNTQATIY